MAERHHGDHHEVSPDDQYRATPPGAGYEHTDANTRIIAHFLFWLAVAAIVVHIGMWGMFALLVEQRREVGEPEFPLAAGVDDRLPPEPRLQQFPLWEYQEFRRREEAILQGYGWVDQGAGTVHIPIGEAMRLIVERGLPARDEVLDFDDEVRERRPAGSSSGRTFQVRRQ
jgi:hypothetical protein